MGLILLISYLAGGLAESANDFRWVLFGLTAFLAFLSISGPFSEGFYREKKKILGDISTFLKNYQSEAEAQYNNGEK